MKNNPIKVLVIDDSAFIRTLISKALNSTENIEVIATAVNGKFGLEKLQKLSPDIVILDLEMPEMNGIEFLKEKNRIKDNTPVIVLSSHAVKGARITMEALALGASEFILKPGAYDSKLDETLKTLTELIIAFTKQKKQKTEISITKEKKEIEKEKKEIEKEKIDDYTKYTIPIKEIPKIEIVSIGISTGGPNALRQILPKFPSNFPVPIVIVQHMPPGFTREFAENLNKICQLPVKEAENNDLLVNGRILIAPGDKHVVFAKKKLATVIELNDDPPINSHKPSVEKLFKSTAEVFGRNSIGCIMTGMGKDGSESIGEILKKGGITIAQDEKTSIVFGMPKNAILNRNINFIKELDEIPELITKIVMEGTI